MCVRLFVANFFGDARILAARKFSKKSSGRRDRFRPKIVEIGAILAIFEPFEVGTSNTRNVLHRTHGMSCFEHKECPASNTRNVLLQTQGMSCFEHKECFASNTKNVLLRTRGMSSFEHTERLASYTRNVLPRSHFHF